MSLLYHMVGYDHKNNFINNNIHGIDEDTFYSQIKLLKNKFSFIYIDEMVERIKKRKSIKKQASVTFDDGYVSILNKAVPILESLEIPATLFLTTKLITGGSFWRDKVRYIINTGMTQEFLSYARRREPLFHNVRSESFYRETKDPAVIHSGAVETMLDRFFSYKDIEIEPYAKKTYCSKNDLAGRRNRYLMFGNHTHSHYVLSSLNTDEQYEEIVQAEKILHLLGLPLSKVFSIPFGRDRDFTAETLDILRQRGYSGYAMSSGSTIENAFSPAVGIRKNDLVRINRLMPENKPAAFVQQ